MGGKSKHDKAWTEAPAPYDAADQAAAASGTFQQTTALDLEKLHALVATEAVRLTGGTGASVTATAGLYWPAYVPFYFRPFEGRESIGWSSVSTNAAVSVSVVEN